MKLLTLLCLVFLATPVSAKELTADVSNHLISIRTDFDGASLVLFGTVDPPFAEQDNVIVLVRGASESVILRQKTRLMGIWMNTQYALFEPVPSFYRLLSARPIAETILPAIAARHEIGVSNIRLPISMADIDGDAIPAFRQAYLDKRRQQQLYSDNEGAVTFLPGNRLFRASIDFPKNVPPGNYQIDIFLVQEGQIIDAQTTPLYVSRDGVGADVHFVAMSRPLTYGIACVIMALAAGWLAAWAFRRA
jgi:uncharacterized protein (TIGR02186 family)